MQLSPSDLLAVATLLPRQESYTLVFLNRPTGLLANSLAGATFNAASRRWFLAESQFLLGDPVLPRAGPTRVLTELPM